MRQPGKSEKCRDAQLYEVANLLIDLYNKYIAREKGADILKGLMTLVYHMNLTEELCILDVERIRLKVMRSQGDERTMSCESFHEWLRDISVDVFKMCDDGGSRALNLLLTLHIVPLATRDVDRNLAVQVLSSRGYIALDASTLRVFMPYSKFLHLWYTSGRYIDGDTARLSPSHFSRLRAAYLPRGVTSTSRTPAFGIFEVLKSCGIFSSSVLEDDHFFFKEMTRLATSPRDVGGTGDALNSLAFPGFLSVLERVAREVNLSPASNMGMGVSLPVKLTIMMQKLSERLLTCTLEAFHSSQGVATALVKQREAVSFGSSAVSTANDSLNQGKSYSRMHRESLSSIPIPVPSLNISSVLWLARQCGLTQLPGLSLTLLMDELVGRADDMRADGFMAGGLKAGSSSSYSALKARTWSLPNLPRVLSEIVESYSTHRPDAMAGGLNQVSSIGRVSLVLAQSLPAVFFVSPSRSPAQLVSMYDPQSVQQLESMSADVDTFFLALHPEPSRSDKLTSLAAAAIVSAYFQKVEVASMREFNRLALTSGVVPHLVSASLVLDTAESLLGFHCTGEALDAKVCKTDWIEILYTLAQLCFTDTDMPAGRDGEEGGGMQKLFDLLKSFSSVSYLSHAIGRSRYGANASNFLKECVQLRSISSTNAPSVVSHGKGRSVFAGREGEGGEGPSDICKGRGRGAGAEVPTLSSRLAARLNIETSIVRARGSSSHIHSGSHRDSSSRCNSPRSTSSNGNINSSCAFPRPTQQEKKDRDRDPSGFSLRQVVIALAHYPCNSFELNPWSLYRMLVSSASSREGEGDGDVTNDVTSDDTMLRMARVFKIFCAQFDVSSLALTEYLSSFYKEDYYVADTAQMLSLRDEEGRHGVPESHFRYDGLSRYTKRVKVMKPAIEGVMDSQVFDLLFSERIAVLLHSHAQLLCWEFSRACSQHRSADPFTRHLRTPLPTARTLRAVPHDCRMSVSGAVQWAQRAAGITEGEAMLQLRRTALLSGGGTVVAGYYLTFSVFLMFAVHCFSAQALLAASLQAHPAEDIFEACLRELLEWSNAILVSVQESLRVDVDILECYYRRISRTVKTHSPLSAGLGRLTASQRLILVRHSVVVFEAMPFEESYMDLPDRPLSHLWDSCRFIRYCCHYGLLERAGSLSLSVPLRVFKAHLAAEGPLTPSPASEQCVLPIESIRCSSTLVLSLLDDMTAEANRGVTDKCDLVLDLLPTMISLLNMDALEGATTHIQRDAAQAQVIWDADSSVSCSVEDMLRYGGDRAMRSFMLYRDQMVRVFGFLTAASSHVLRNRIPPAQGIFKLPLCGDVCLQEGEEGEGEGGGSSGEALLSATCAYLSCCGILQAGKMAKIAQHSLHSRLRPLVSSTSHRELPTQWTRDLYRAAGVPANGSNINKSKQRGQSETSGLHDLVTEFEVMLLRCAFCCWEASGALSSGEGGGTGDRHEADPHTLLEASCMGTVDRDSRDPSSVWDAAYHYCIEGMLAPQGHMEDPSLWGVDFLGPFARTLFAISEVPLPRSLATIDLEVVAVAQAAASALKRAEAARLQLEEVEAAQREERARLAEQQRLARESEVHRKYVDSHMLECGAVTSLSATDEPRKAEGMRDLMERSSYLSNTSAGINVLLDGSKEQLWPVYATFCSCGDSSKPGNLSGPNLFFLLCRLGILSEEVALSDVGMLLHRISAHLQAQSPLSTPSPSSSSSSSTSSMSLDGWDSPSLSFEQFLVFLCAYSELLYSGASQATLSNPASLSDDTETTALSSLSPVPNAPMLQTAGPKSAHRHAHAHGCRPSRSTKPGRHGGDSIASDTDSLSSSSRVGNSVTEGLSNPQDKEGFQKARFQGDQPKSTGLNIIICSDACEAEGAPSASRAWFTLWQDRMNSSVDFKCLLEVRILPMLRGSTLLACPQEARLRDTYAVLFSLEVLLSLQSMEGTLRAVVTSCRNEPVGVDGYIALSPVTLSLKKIKIVPQIVSEERIARLEEDMMSLSVYVCMSVSDKDRDKQRKSIGKKSPSLPPVTDSERHTSRSRGRTVPTLLFAQWEWTVCVVALEAVQSAIRLRHTPTEREAVPTLVAETIVKIVTAMYQTSPLSTSPHAIP